MSPLNTFGSLVLLASAVVAQGHSHYANATVTATAIETITLTDYSSSQASTVFVTRYVTVSAAAAATQASFNGIASPWNNTVVQAAEVNWNNTAAAAAPWSNSTENNLGGSIGSSSVVTPAVQSGAKPVTPIASIVGVNNVGSGNAAPSVAPANVGPNVGNGNAVPSVPAGNVAPAAVSSVSTVNTISIASMNATSSATEISSVASSSSAGVDPVSSSGVAPVSSVGVAPVSSVDVAPVSSAVVAPTSSAQAVASSTTSTQAAASSAVSDLESVMLATHNQDRALHSAPPLTWSSDLAAYAQNYLDNNNLCNGLVHSGGPYGENLAAGMSPADSVAAWYNEISQYDFNNPGFSAATGHFTQVVWVATTQLGCAQVTCPAGSTFGNVVSCNYNPPGNVLGQFATNVLQN